MSAFKHRSVYLKSRQLQKLVLEPQFRHYILVFPLVETVVLGVADKAVSSLVMRDSATEHLADEM